MKKNFIYVSFNNNKHANAHHVHMHSGTLVSSASDQAYSFLLRDHQDSAYYMFTRATQSVRGVLDPPVSVFSLSLYRHPFLHTLFTSRFLLIINNNINNVLRLIQMAPITSKSHTHPSHSQTSRLLTQSLSLGIPVYSSSSSNPVYGRHVDSSSLGFSLSSHRQSYIVLVRVQFSLYRLIINKIK